jgi:large subunit ribosomal protein L10
MSKPIKNMLMREYTARLTGAEDAMVISIRGMKATATNKLRLGLAKKQIKVTVVRNALARKTVAGTSLDALSEVLTGPSAIVAGGSVVEAARAIVAVLKDFPGLELKGAVLDGQIFKGDAGVKELSQFPTKDEAIGRVVALVVGPGRKLVAQIKGPGSNIAGIIQAIETKL